MKPNRDANWRRALISIPLFVGTGPLAKVIVELAHHLRAAGRKTGNN
jgi:hypothetical protein